MSLTYTLQKIKEDALYSMAAVSAFAISFSISHADEPQTTVGQGIKAASTNLVNEIASVYCGSLAWLLLAVDVLILACSKNEKVITVSKTALAFIIVAYVVLKILSNGNGGVIGSTADKLNEWISQ